MQEQVFISYRREGGDITAKLICEALKNHGYTVFYDYDSISGGFFDERILQAIEGCNDFVLVLPKNSLDRCVNEEDWVRAEIVCALKNKKNIVPVMLPEFEFPTNLPDAIADVSRINAVHFIMAYFEGVMGAIYDRLTSVPKFVQREASAAYSESLKYTFRDKLNGYAVAVGSCTDSEIRIPESYNGKAVVAVAEDGFRGCSALKTVVLPETISVLESGAFYQCSLLENVNIPSRVTEIGKWAFYQCTSLKSVAIPRDVRSIALRAFSGCTSLQEFSVDKDNRFYCDRDNVLYTRDMHTLVSYACGRNDTSYAVPPGVVEIGDSAFSKCSTIAEVTFPDSLTKIEKFAFLDCPALDTVVFPAHISTIGGFAFKNCPSLLRAIVPDGLQIVSEDLFRGCTSLKTVVLPETVKRIEDSAFYECSALESVNIPNHVTEIGKWAFYKCFSLEQIFLPKSVRDVGLRAFTDCKAMQKFSVDVDNESYCDYDHILYTKDMRRLVHYPCCRPESLYTVPDGVVEIGDSSFSQALRLSGVVLPESVEVIEKFAFIDCSELKTVVLPNSAERIESFAFKNCSSLVSITVPKGITVIAEDVFRNCSSLKTVILPETVRNIDEGAFNTCSSLGELNLPGKVADIGRWAFYGCSSLKSIALPRSVKNIGSRAFAACTALKKISISVFNSAYRSTGNALFTKDMKKLFTYAMGCDAKTYAIPSTVTYIEDSAFSGSNNLEVVTIPASVVEFGEFVFNECKKLQTVRFSGTMAAYKAVNVKSNSFRKAKATEVRCADGNVKI